MTEFQKKSLVLQEIQEKRELSARKVAWLKLAVDISEVKDRDDMTCCNVSPGRNPTTK